MGRKATASKKNIIWDATINKYIERKRFIIYPDDKWKVLFDFFIAVLTVYFCVIVPYRLCFSTEASSTLTQVELMFDGFFFIDIALRFRCAIQYQAMIIDDWKIIAKKYLKAWFWIDVFSSFPFQIFAKSLSFARLGRLLRISKLFKLSRVFRGASPTQLLNIESSIDYRQTMYLSRMLKFFFLTMMTLHILSCFWNLVV